MVLCQGTLDSGTNEMRIIVVRNYNCDARRRFHSVLLLGLTMVCPSTTTAMSSGCPTWYRGRETHASNWHSESVVCIRPVRSCVLTRQRPRLPQSPLPLS